MAADVITGVVSQIAFQSSDENSPYTIARLRTGETVKGPAHELVVGLTYTFQGNWKNETFRGQPQKVLQFTKHTEKEPHTRAGVVAYLRQYAPGIGPTLAGRLWDAFGELATVTLRTNPAGAAAAVDGLSVEKAEAAATELQKNVKFEAVRIDLTELFAGKGFSKQLPAVVIKKWGVEAAKRIRRDPFCLLVAGFASAGFNRCDQLYLQLHCKPWRLKRLMLCIWHSMRSSQEGHTWHEASVLIQIARQLVADADPSGIEDGLAQSDARLKRAITLGVRAKWLAVIRDPSGRLWISEAKAAENEDVVAESIQRLTAVDPFAGESLEEREIRLEEQVYQQIAGRLDHADSAFAEDEFDEEDLAGEIDSKILAGRATGICQFCQRTLLTDESKSRGYGPVCAKRHGLPYAIDTQMEVEAL